MQAGVVGVQLVEEEGPQSLSACITPGTPSNSSRWGEYKCFGWVEATGWKAPTSSRSGCSRMDDTASSRASMSRRVGRARVSHLPITSRSTIR